MFFYNLRLDPKLRFRVKGPNLRTLSPQRWELPRLYNSEPLKYRGKGGGAAKNHEKCSPSVKEALL